MSENNCFYCSTPINSSYNFCVNCEKQVKCLSCAEVLLSGKSKCLKCGNPISIDSVTPTMNVFTLEENQTRTSSTRVVKGTLTDTAITQVAALLARSVTPPMKIPSQVHKVSTGQTALPFPIVEQVEDIDEQIAVSTSQVNSGNESEQEKLIRSFFAEDGKDSLVARTIDFKGQNKKEQQIRFMLLFIAAYNLFFKKQPISKTVFDALADKNMLDGNAQTHHFKYVETNYLMKIGDGYELNMDGDKEISRILLDMKDSSKKGFVDWGKSVKTRGKYNRIDEETNKKLLSWIDMEANIGGFDIRTLKTPTKYAMFGTYLITKLLSVEKAVPYNVVHDYLSKKFSTIPISKDAMRKAFTRPSNAARFEKTSEGNFYLTPKAEKEVAVWLEGRPVKEEETS